MCQYLRVTGCFFPGAIPSFEKQAYGTAAKRKCRQARKTKNRLIDAPSTIWLTTLPGGLASGRSNGRTYHIPRYKAKPVQEYVIKKLSRTRSSRMMGT